MSQCRNQLSRLSVIEYVTNMSHLDGSHKVNIIIDDSMRYSHVRMKTQTITVHLYILPQRLRWIRDLKMKSWQMDCAIMLIPWLALCNYVWHIVVQLYCTVEAIHCLLKAIEIYTDMVCNIEQLHFIL